MNTLVITRITGGLAASVWVLTAAEGLSASIYSVTDLGALTNLSPRTDSMPTAINDHGKLAGVNVVGGAYRALLYGGSWTNLGTLGGDESLAGGLNDADAVVGYSLTTNGLVHAFLWTPGDTGGVPTNPQMRDLGVFPHGTNSAAYDINRSGQICGYSETNFQAVSRERAFLYSAGTMTDIGHLLGASLPNSYAYGINDAGHIAGTAYDALYTYPHAFFYNGTTAVEIGGALALDSFALAINNSDQITGYLTGLSGDVHAFRYAAGVMSDLGTLGGHYSYGNAINNSNVIVGGSFTDSGDSIYHAFICVSNSMVDLNGQLDASGAGWTLVEARAINDLGQIAGIGNYGGVAHGFLLSPPPVVTGVSLRGSNVLVSFTTIRDWLYSLLGRQDLGSGGWSILATNIQGTGGIVTATNAGVLGLPRRFYRVGASVP